MIRLSSTAGVMAAMVCFTGALSAGVAEANQDPMVTLPDSYKLELENDYVKVVRVHYDAGARLPDHTHPAGTTVYVYLNDSEGVVFSHSSGSGRAVTRPPVQAGGIRIASGQEEHHAVENKAATANDFLRIFLKTDNGGSRSMRRTPPTEMEFVNKQLKITRVNLQSGDSTVTEAKDNPALRVVISPGMKEWKVLPQTFTQWLEPGQSEKYSMSGDPKQMTQVVRIEFLTRPR